MRQLALALFFLCAFLLIDGQNIILG